MNQETNNPVPSDQTVSPAAQEKSEGREKELAALSYLWIFSLFILLAKRDSPFIQHHARRGFVLFFFSIVFWAIPFLRYGEFAILVLVIFGFISAALGNENTIPILSEFADGTLRLGQLKNYWHITKHGAIKVIKPDHITPEFRQQITEQKSELTRQEQFLSKQKEITEMEEKKLSALYQRIGEDEKKIDALRDEVRALEGAVEKIKKI